MRIDHQTDEEMILIDEVSDEAVEAAAFVALGGLPTLPHTYCFACPSIRCEAIGNNDLRRYIAVQHHPFVIIPFGLAEKYRYR